MLEKKTVYTILLKKKIFVIFFEHNAPLVHLESIHFVQSEFGLVH